MIALLLTSEDKLLRSRNDDYNSAMTADTVNLLKKLLPEQVRHSGWQSKTGLSISFYLIICFVCHKYLPTIPVTFSCTVPMNLETCASTPGDCQPENAPLAVAECS